MRKVYLLFTALVLLFNFNGCESVKKVIKKADVVGEITDKVPLEGTSEISLDFKSNEVLCSYYEGRTLTKNIYYTAKILTPATAATKNNAEVIFVRNGKKAWSRYVIPSHKASKAEMKLGKMVLYHVWANSENISADSYRKQYWRFGRISSTDDLFKDKVEVSGKSVYVKWLRMPNRPVE